MLVRTGTLYVLLSCLDSFIFRVSGHFEFDPKMAFAMGGLLQYFCYGYRYVVRTPKDIQSLKNKQSQSFACIMASRCNSVNKKR